MDYFNYKNGELFVEGVSCKEIADKFSTPLYVYSLRTFKRHFDAFNDPLKGMKHLVCFAVKANSNINILKELAKWGSGFDIVSRGELERVLIAGGDPRKTVFSGVGKSKDEIRFALDKNIKCFNIESISELRRVNQIALELNTIAPVSLRVNPDVDAKTHPYIATGLKENKFGISFSKAIETYTEAVEMKGVSVKGVDCHIGSQLTTIGPFLEALERLKGLIRELVKLGIELEHIDFGGGLGVRYKDEEPPHPSVYLNEIVKNLEEFKDIELIFEPGRAIAANAGILLTRVEYLKENEGKHFAVVDAAMNDLMRPALYQAWQEVVKVDLNNKSRVEIYDIVGPVCETGDYLAKDREIELKEDELIAIRSSGAYGFTMSSNYNSRPRAAEVLIKDSNATLIRKREDLSELWKNEII